MSDASWRSKTALWFQGVWYLASLCSFVDNFTIKYRVFVCEIWKQPLCGSVVSASGGNFSKNEQLLLISSCVCFIEVRGELTQRWFRHLEVCWWNFNCRCLLSALGKRHPPSSSSGSEARTAPLYMENGTSWGSPARGQGLPEDVTVHTQMAATSVLSQSSLPAVEGEEETTLPRGRNSSGQEPSWLPLSRTSAYSPPSDRLSCECFCPSSTLWSHAE